MHAKHQPDTPLAQRDVVKIGVLSDTHGHLTNQVLDALTGTDLILHAGDIDNHKTLFSLEEVGDVYPVRGNMDFGNWTQALPSEEYIEAGGTLIYMIHNLSHISLNPEASGIRMVISGHTHRPSLTEKNGVVYLNPGSASFPRGGHHPSVAIVDIANHRIRCRHIDF